MRADGEAFARYTAHVPHFQVLRELELMKSPINRQVREINQLNACPPGRHETRETPAARKGNLITTTPRTGYTHTIYMSNRCRVTGEVIGAYSRAVRRGAVHTQHWPFGIALPTWTCDGTWT